MHASSKAPRTPAYLHHVDHSVRVLHVVLGLTDFHANSAGEALTTLQNIEPAIEGINWENMIEYGCKSASAACTLPTALS